MCCASLPHQTHPLGGLQSPPGHLAPGRADYEQAFKGANLSTEKISGSLFEISGTLAKTLATLKVSGTLFEASKNAQELFFKSVDPIL